MIKKLFFVLLLFLILVPVSCQATLISMNDGGTGVGETTEIGAGTPLMQVQETQIDWPTSPMGTDLTPTTEFHELIQYIYEWGISLGGIFVFIMLVFAGMKYLTSAGDPGKMKAALEKIRSAILGLVLLLTSFIILNTINPELTQLRALPHLWGDRGFEAFRLKGVGEGVLPCDFVVVYPEINFEGDPIKIIRFEDGVEVYRIEGIPELKKYSDPWSSAKSFIKIAENQKKLMEDGGPMKDVLRYDRNGAKAPLDGEYMEGGICSIDIFFTERRWFIRTPCGGRMGNVSLPSRDISRSRMRDKDITCVEVLRTLPKGEGGRIIHRGGIGQEAGDAFEGMGPYAP